MCPDIEIYFGFIECAGKTAKAHFVYFIPGGQIEVTSTI